MPVVNIDREKMLALHQSIEATAFQKFSSVKAIVEGLGIATLGLAPTVVEADRIPDGSQQIGEMLTLPINDGDGTIISVLLYLAGDKPGVVIHPNRPEESVSHRVYYPTREQMRAAGFLQPAHAGA